MKSHALYDYLALAERSGAFSPAEMEILGEVLADWAEDPQSGYFVLEENLEGRRAGFLVYGPTPMTDFAYDLYWIAVDPPFQRRGVGLRLLRRLDGALDERGARAVIRVETSGKASYEGQRRFYEAGGYRECGRLADFYGEGDDLVLYGRSLEAKEAR
ncbi:MULTISPECIES: GNAT family N-acetyltransferase [Synergistales]|nr:GNAT family N-acetyltransferase [Aminithiophilus ramosus]